MAVANSIIDRTSPVLADLRAARCDTLVVDELSLSGPTSDMMRVVESEISGLRLLRVCDVFAGTGALGMRCLAMGAAHCTFIDQFSDAIRLNTRNLSASRYSIHVGDAFAFTSNKRWDLVIMDPYFDLSERVAIELFPRFATSASMIIFDISFRADKYWILRVKSALQLTGGHLRFVEKGESVIAIWKPL